VRPLEAVVSELDLSTGNQSFLTGKSFKMIFDMTDRWSAATSSMVGWSQVKAETIAVSGGTLTVSSTDAEVEAFIVAGLTAVYGANFSGTAGAATLSYVDPEHYLLQTNLPSGTKPVFKGAAQSALADIQWQLVYCTIAGDDTSKYSTILSGTQNGNTLTIAPDSVEFPVSGVGGVRDGYKISQESLLIA
jgi:hypothetical protein